MSAASTVRRVLRALPLLLIASLALAPRARAQQDDGEAQPSGEDEEDLARRVFDTGRSYFERAEYERAIEAFREAYRLSGRVEMLLNIARAYEALSREAEAIAALEEAIAADPEIEATAGPRIERLRRQMEHREATGDGSTGEADLETDDADAAPPPPADDGPSGMFWAGAVTAGVGAALLIVAIGTGVASNDIYTDLEQTCAGGVCPRERQDDIDRGQSLAVASTVTLVIGGVAAGAGIVLMLVDALSGGGSEDEAVSLAPGPGEVGLALRARM
ncbi:MAG: tetratricopeptide repeat protein [Sandaracinaceae bacterium]